MFRTVVLTAAILAAIEAPAQKGVPWWRGSFDAALEEAKLRNVPLIVAFIQDGEEANDRVVSGLYADPAFIRLASDVVSIMCSRETHAPKKETIDGRDEAVCSKYGSVGCTVHQAHEIYGRGMFWTSKGVTTPHHVVCLPDGTEVARLQDVHPLGSFESAVREARKKLGPGLSAADYKSALAGLKSCEEVLQQGRFAEAVAGILAFEKQVGTGPLLERSKALRGLLDARAKEIVEEVTRAREEGRILDALRAAETGAAAFAGFPAGKDLQAIGSEIGRTPDGRRARADLEKEKRAVPVLAAASEAEGKRDFQKAVREYARVVTIAPDSPQAVEATARIQTLRGDPDVEKLARKSFDEFDADSLLRQALAKKEAGDLAGYRTALDRIVKDLGETSVARRAKKLLESGR